MKHADGANQVEKCAVKQENRKSSLRSRKYFIDEQDLFFDDSYKDGEKEKWGDFGFECGELVNE